MSEPSTYIRKIGPKKYEYGFVQYAENFRKQPDIFSPVGVTNSVADAESARASLCFSQEESAHENA